MCDPNLTPAQLAIENRLLRVLLESAVAHLLDLTDCTEHGDVPDGPDPFIGVPKGHLDDARNAAQYIARKAGIQTE